MDSFTPLSNHLSSLAMMSTWWNSSRHFIMGGFLQTWGHQGGQLPDWYIVYIAILHSILCCFFILFHLYCWIPICRILHGYILYHIASNLTSIFYATTIFSYTFTDKMRNTLNVHHIRISTRHYSVYRTLIINLQWRWESGWLRFNETLG